MIRRIDHVSIAVQDLEKARAFFLDILGGRELFSAPMPEQKYRWTTIELGSSCLVELIDPLNREGFVQRFLDGRGEGLHHVTIQVDDIHAMHRHLEERGIPTFGFSEALAGWKEFFIHPKHAFGTLLQFAEFRPLDWIEPGYVPRPYWEFADPQRIEAAVSIEIKKVKALGGVTVEIRQGEKTISVSTEALPGLIAALKKEEAALADPPAG